MNIKKTLVYHEDIKKYCFVIFGRIRWKIWFFEEKKHPRNLCKIQWIQKIVKIVYFLNLNFDIVPGSGRWLTDCQTEVQVCPKISAEFFFIAQNKKLTISSKKVSPIFTKNGGGGIKKDNVVLALIQGWFNMTTFYV